MVFTTTLRATGFCEAFSTALKTLPNLPEPIAWILVKSLTVQADFWVCAAGVAVEPYFIKFKF